MIRGKITNSKELSEIVAMKEEDEIPTSATYPGYFAFDIFLKNSSKDESKDDVLQLNYDSSLEILDTEKTSTGLQNTARIAFVKYNGKSDVMADQATILKETAGVGVGASTPTITDVAIWEPNSGDHVEYIVQNNNKITWAPSDATAYATKVLSNGTKGFDVNTQMPTYGLKESAIGSNIADIYKWDGSESNVQKQVTLQTNKKTDSDYTIKEGVQNLISTSDTGNKQTTFGIAPNAISRIRVYLWLEGQDVDCINYASQGGGVKVNIGLVNGSKIGATSSADLTE